MANWRRLLGNNRDPGNLLTALVGPDKKRGGWDVAWIGEGACPARERAETLTEVVSRAAAAAAQLYARYPPNPVAELQLAIYPWDYPLGGAMYDISEDRDGYTAHDLQDQAAPIEGPTLEDLIAVAEHTAGAGIDRCCFRWIRPVESLISDASAPDPGNSQP